MKAFHFRKEKTSNRNMQHHFKYTTSIVRVNRCAASSINAYFFLFFLVVS